MTAVPDPQRLSDALLGFSLENRFPEDIASLPPVTGADLLPAIDALSRSKADLEVCRIVP
jgi:protein transport protein DSL1/ZW10